MESRVCGAKFVVQLKDQAIGDIDRENAEIVAATSATTSVSYISSRVTLYCQRSTTEGGQTHGPCAREALRNLGVTIFSSDGKCMQEQEQ